MEAAKETAKTGATEFCIVAAVRGPNERLMSQVRAGIEAIKAEVDINIACSLGILTQEQVDELKSMGVHRYNHNLECAFLLQPRRDDPFLRGALADMRDGQGVGHGAVLWWVGGHGRNSRAVSGARRPACPARPA